MGVRWLKFLILVLLTNLLSAVVIPVWAQDAEDEQAETCPFKEGWFPAEQLPFILAEHQEWLNYQHQKNALSEELASGSSEQWEVYFSPKQANLCNANLRNANLRGADLRWAQLDGAILTGTDLSWAKLNNANLTKADLTGANLQRAELGGATLTDADLRWAKLNYAIMDSLEAAGTRLANADLTGATYTVITGPPASYVAHIQGLEAVTFTPGNETGLVQIRESLQKAGLRHLEREATYAIERNRTWYAICGLVVPNSITSSITSFIRNLIIWDVDVWESCITLWETAKLIKDSEEKNEVVKSYEEFGTLFEGLVRLAFFEWTTGYGFYPFRAIYIIVGLGGGLILVYVLPIRFAAPPPRAGSSHYQNWFLGSMTRGWLGLRQRWANGKICRVWSADRIKESWDQIRGITIEVKNEPEAERLCGDWRFALKYAAYFSLLSIFHIGWRDLNVGTWIARIQPGEYVLRPAGWVKFISGIQSLLSVYLLAIWALTYFGRPFQ